ENRFKSYLSGASADDNTSSAYINLAQIAINRKDLSTADEWLAKVEFQDGQNPVWFGVQMRRALLMSGAGKHLAARQFLQTITANRDNQEVQLLQTEAQIMKNAGQNLEAMMVLEAALNNSPRNAELLYDYAMQAESLKRYAEMETSLKQLIQLAPENPFAYNALGYSYADRNINLDQALWLIEKANQLSPNDPYILDSLGWIQFRLKNWTKAEEILRRSFTMRQDPDITVHLGEVLWVQDKKTEAQQLFLDAKKKDANNELLKSTIERLGVSLATPRP
ncbi:MAG: hypothetical protein K2X63_07020, partial [Burkholderiaceae bacterium]|nr:hypothetical protein [Burkholderiaceae bacterium]